MKDSIRDLLAAELNESSILPTRPSSHLTVPLHPQSLQPYVLDAGAGFHAAGYGGGS